MIDYTAILNSYRAELAQDEWVLADMVKTGAPKWAISNAEASIAATKNQLSKWADLAFAFGGR